MIVECPACHSRYRIESAEVLDDSTFFECSQEGCRCVFPYSPPPLAGGGKAVPPPRPLGAEALAQPTKGTKECLTKPLGHPCGQSERSEESLRCGQKRDPSRRLS